MDTFFHIIAYIILSVSALFVIKATYERDKILLLCGIYLDIFAWGMVLALKLKQLFG